MQCSNGGIMDLNEFPSSTVCGVFDPLEVDVKADWREHPSKSLSDWVLVVNDGLVVSHS